MIPTLGDLLVTDQSKARVAEGEWAELIQTIARGDQFALRALYERTHRLAFTLIMRITHDGAVAADATIDVFCEAWRSAGKFGSLDESALGWLMNLARSCAINRLHQRPADRVANSRRRKVEQAVAHLTNSERAAIEAAFFSESTCIEIGAALDLPLDTVKREIHSGMAHLAQDLAREDMHPSRLAPHNASCSEAQSVALYALGALSPGDMFRAAAHIAACPDCRRDLKAHHRVTDLFAFWPTELLRPSADLWVRLTRRIAAENPGQIELGARRHRRDPAWETVAPGISCNLLATDAEKHRVSMLVRLAPGADYPPHRHAGVEELHLLHGELWIDGRKFHPGDYNRAERGTSDAKVSSETGCTCVLITSQLDELH